MNEFDAILSEDYGLEFDAPITNTGKGGFERYQHVTGEYKGIFGRVKIFYINANEERCEKDEVGARQDFALADVIITKSPDGHGLDANLAIPDGASYGSIVHKQYITLDPELQWRNRSLFQDFAIANSPDLNIIIPGKNYEKDNSDFTVNLSKLSYYLGAPIVFEFALGKKKKSAYAVDGYHLTSKELTADKFKKRVEFMENLYDQLDVLLEKENESRKSKSKEEKPVTSALPQQAASADELLNDEYE